MDENSSGKTRRRKGTWSLAVRAEAKRLYISGSPLTVIATELEVPVNTMMYWRKVDKWVAERNVRTTLPMVLPSERTFTEITSQKQDAIDLYTKLIIKAKEGIDDETLMWRDKKQAADALVAGVKGLAEIFERNVNMVFLQEVLQIIIDEISDETLRQQIGGRLISLGRSWEVRKTAS